MSKSKKKRLGEKKKKTNAILETKHEQAPLERGQRGKRGEKMWSTSLHDYTKA